MTVSLKHTFQSAKDDSLDATVIQPSNWNQEHQLTLATNKLLGRATAGTGAAEELSIGTALSISGGTLAVTNVPVANGGTGVATLPANNVLIGNGTSAVTGVAPGTSGNVLTSNGTTWSSAGVPASGSTGQVQYNNAGVLGAVSSGTTGQALLSQGAGSPPIWGTLSSSYNKVGDFVSPTDQFLFYAAGNINALTERGWTPGVAKFTSSTFGSNNPAIPNVVNWSNYYNAWYGLMNVFNPSTATATSYLCLSSDGVNWWGAGDLPTISAPRSLNTSYLGIDDSNGRFFMSWDDNTNFTAGIVYHTTPGNFSSWTESGTIVNNTGYSQTANLEDMQYVNFGTSGTSGLVLSFYSYSNFRIYVVPSGSVTPVLKASRYTTNTRGSIISWDYTNKKCVVCCNANTASQRVVFVENDVNGAWTLPSVTGITSSVFDNADIGGAYAVVVGSGSSTSYLYSNTYSSWTTASSPAGNIQALWHNGTYWFMRTTVGVYYTATAIPTGWTRIGTTNWLVTAQSTSKARRTMARKV